METLNCLVPVLAVHQVIPVRNEVAQRTSVVTERNATVHATTGLCVQLVMFKRFVDLFPVFQPQFNGTPLWPRAFPLQKTCCLTHGRPPLLALPLLLRPDLQLSLSP